MKYFHKKRLQKLATFLRNLPRKQFDIENWVTESDFVKGHECGTVCCAVGWMPKVDPRNWKWEKSENLNPTLNIILV